MKKILLVLFTAVSVGCVTNTYFISGESKPESNTANPLNFNPNLQGEIIETGRELDLAIVGPGYFEIALPNGGSVFTRNGHFYRNSIGEICISGGLVMKSAPAIDHNTQEIIISVDGLITCKMDDTANTYKYVGQITLIDFENPYGLIHLGNGLYLAGADCGDSKMVNPQFSLLRQGFLEKR